MAKKSNDYWKRRFEAMEDSQYQKSQEYYGTVKEQFRQAQNDIQMDMERWYDRLAKNNDISLAGAKKLLKKDELSEFQWNVNQYIKAGEENAVVQRWMKELENASAKYHVNYLQAMKMQRQQHVEKLFTEYEGGTTEFFHKTFGEQYKHTAYEIAQGTGVGSNLTHLDTRKIDTLVKKPWAADGANYRDRITMLAKDAVSAKMAQCFLTINGNRYNFMNAKNVEAKVTRTKTKVAILGKMMKGNKTTGLEGSVKATFYYNTSIFRKALQEFKKTGQDFYFDMQITNEDPTSGAGRQTVRLINCDLDDMDAENLWHGTAQHVTCGDINIAALFQF